MPMPITLQKQIATVLIKYDMPDGVLARLMGVSGSHLSRILDGFVELSPKWRERMTLALAFTVEMQAHADAAGIPVCFHSYPRLAPAWNLYQKSLSSRNGDERSAAD